LIASAKVLLYFLITKLFISFFVISEKKVLFYDIFLHKWDNMITFAHVICNVQKQMIGEITLCQYLKQDRNSWMWQGSCLQKTALKIQL